MDLEDARVQIKQDEEAGHYELNIRHVRDQDNGLYTCTAMNVAGTATCDGRMKVIGEYFLLKFFP